MSLAMYSVAEEENMLRIGEFSRLSQVTIKALRYYDDMKLLKPAMIDKFTGYRYYSVDQLPRIHRIIAFKELGLSLEQIANLLHDNPSTDDIRDILRGQEAEIKQRISEEQARLAQVEFRLRMIDMEDKMPDIEVIVKPIPAQRALTLRTAMRGDSLYKSLIAFQTEIEQAIAQRQFKFAGPVTEIRYADEFEIDYEDVEFVLPVDESQTEDVPLATAGTLKLTTVPEMAMAATYMHHGKDPQSDVLPMLQRWIVANNYQLLGVHRVVYHRGPFQHAEYADWILEFQHEIAPLP